MERRLPSVVCFLLENRRIVIDHLFQLHSALLEVVSDEIENIVQFI